MEGEAAEAAASGGRPPVEGEAAEGEPGEGEAAEASGSRPPVGSNRDVKRLLEE